MNEDGMMLSSAKEASCFGGSKVLIPSNDLYSVHLSQHGCLKQSSWSLILGGSCNGPDYT